MCKQEKFPVFRENLNKLLSESGQTIVSFAETLGTSRTSLGYYLNGERIPDALMIKQICERCNVSSDWLLGLSDVKVPETEIRAISDYTGLTEQVIDNLHFIQEIGWLSGCMAIFNSAFSDYQNLFSLLMSLKDTVKSGMPNVQAPSIPDALKEEEWYLDFLEEQKTTDWKHIMFIKACEKMKDLLKNIADSEDVKTAYCKEEGIEYGKP